MIIPWGLCLKIEQGPLPGLPFRIFAFAPEEHYAAFTMQT